MTERFNANAEDAVGTSSSGGPFGSGQDLVALGVGEGSGQTASRQENNSSIGFEFPIRWEDVTDTLGRLQEKKYLGEFVDDMEMRDKLIEDYLSTSVVNGVVGENGIAVSKSQGVVALSITPPYLQLLCPVGTIHAYPGYTAPLGWLLCDGTTSTAGYPQLAALVGSTTPNLKGKVIVGYNTAETEFDNMFETGGAKTVTLTAAQSGMPAHNHTFQSSSFALQPVRFSSDANEYVFAGYGTADTSTASAVNASSGHNNLQPYMTLNYIIKRDYI